MRWIHTEYMLKGIFLGLLLFAALQEPDWNKTGLLAALIAGGLAIGLLISFAFWLMRGIRVGGRIFSLLLFLLLESPTLVYAGLIGGLIAGAFYVRKEMEHGGTLLAALTGGGAVLGFALGELRRVGPQMWRLGIALAGGTALVAGAIYFFEQDPQKWAGESGRLLGVHILIGLPFFYLLVFAGEAEESEAEVAALCAAAAIGLWLVRLTPKLPALGLVLPLAMFIVYTRNVMPGLRVFKHTLRGYTYFQMGRVRPSLRAFRRAVQLDPNNQLALSGLAKVHSGIDVIKLQSDPETVVLLDLDLCLNRAGTILWKPEVTPEQQNEVQHLLDLVAAQQPSRLPEVEYWRAIADMRAKRGDDAAKKLESLLDGAAWSGEQLPSRTSILLPAWQLSLLRSRELASKVGQPQLALPGRRMEAISVVERHLAQSPQDADAWELKRVLYEGLNEREFLTRPPQEGEFDAGYIREQGLARIGDPIHWRRGVELLLLAARAQPAHGPSLFVKVAQACEAAGELDNAKRTYELLKEAGQTFGPKNYSADEQATYFGIIKKMADDAMSRGDDREAIEYLRIYAEYERAGLETLRQLAQLHENLKEVLPALQYNDRALLFNAADADLLQRKDRYYYSVLPDQVKVLPESVRKGLDADYCVRKARQILSNKNADIDSIDWAAHLLELARLLKPDSLEVKVLWARAQLWKGERDQALQMLEDVREAKPAKFESSADEEAWYRCAQMLGDLYLNEYNRPDLAVPCYLDFRTSSKSGADTLYKLGQAYENLGDMPRAAYYYEQVTGYTEHPRYYDAQESLRRVKQPQS